ncbi:hypothetical protein ABPG74_017849 [Tetrahymena malaccensis]
MNSLIQKGGIEAGIFISSFVFFKLWVNKRTNSNNSNAHRNVFQPTDLERVIDPEDSSRQYNVYPEEKIVVRFLH